MGIRTYLKLLKTNMVRIRNSKQVKEEAKQAAAAAPEEEKGTIADEMDSKEAAALVEASQKVGGQTAAISNPSPAKKAKKGAKGAAKKKGVAKKKAPAKK